jgi:hypothetical protein
LDGPRLGEEAFGMFMGYTSKFLDERFVEVFAMGPCKESD